MMNKNVQKDLSNVSSKRATKEGSRTREAAGSKTVSLHLHIDQDLLDDLRDLAHAKGVSLTRLMIASAEHEVLENTVKLAVYRQNRR